MKHFLLSIILLVFFGCDKNTTEPKPDTPADAVEGLYIFRAAGYTSLDTAELKINSKVFVRPTYGYNVAIRKKDTLRFSFSGWIPKSETVCDFAIWKNENKLPSESIKIFSSKKTVFSKDSVVLRNDTTINGNDTTVIQTPIDTLTIVRVRASISGSLIVD